MPDQHEVNLLPARMPDADRQILAGLMAKEVELGVFETLKALEQFETPPFETGYEGSSFNDFIGRLGDWEWPRPDQLAPVVSGAITKILRARLIEKLLARNRAKSPKMSNSFGLLPTPAIVENQLKKPAAYAL
jgi:hypothetical protein